jgi:hypothetical protein
MQTTNLYYANKDRLSLLPQMFTGMVAVGFVLVSIVILNSFFYIEVIAENIPFFKTSVNYQNPESLLAAEEDAILLNKQIAEQTPEGVQVARNCYLKQVSEQPTTITPVLDRTSSWWQATSCDLDLQVIQIINRPISDFEIDLNGDNYSIQITSESQFGIFYGQPNSAVDLNLQEIIEISKNTANNQNFALAIDSQRIGSQKISLVGDCQQVADNCELWVSETFSNTSTQISNQITSITYQGKNLMDDYNYVRIARTQDEFPEVVNLIYRNDFGDDMVFVRLDYTNGNVLQRVNITLQEDQIYNRFYR